jgi:hypothetical protein
MANEIYQKYSSGFSLDAYVIRKTDDKVFIETTGAFEDWVDGNVLTYDIPLVDIGDGYYSVDFPVAITDEGVYRVVVKLRVGPNAAVGDLGIGQGEISWDGTAEIDIFTLDNSINVLIASGSKVLNVLGPGE